MKKEFLACIALSSNLILGACSPMNSEFSCNATASDSCMTIEQVDAMTRYADGNNRTGSRRMPHKGGTHYEASNSQDRAKIWVSPHHKNYQGNLNGRRSSI